MDIEHNKINVDNYKKKDIEELRKLLSPIEYSVNLIVAGRALPSQ